MIGFVPRPLRGSSMLVIGLAITAPSMPSPANAQPPNCVVRAVPDPTYQLPYEPLGDRCEGYYAQLLSPEEPLRVVSLTMGPESQTAAGAQLTLAWRAPGGAPTVITATSLRSLRRYLMSTSIPASSTTFQWKLDRVGQAGLRLADFGLIARTNYKFGRQERVILLPVRVGSAPRGAATTITLVAGSTLQSLTLSMARLKSDGSEETLFADRAARTGVFSAGSPIRVTIPPVRETGYYRVSVAGTAGRRTFTTASAYMYLSGEGKP